MIPASAPPASGGTRALHRAAALGTLATRARPALSRLSASSQRSARRRSRSPSRCPGPAAHAELPRVPTSASSRIRFSKSSASRSSSTRASARRSRCCRTRRCRRDAFYQLFLATLEVHGFVALDSGDAIQIVPDANARFGARRRLRDAGDRARQHRRRSARSDPAAAAAAVRAPRRASVVERADRRGPARTTSRG